MRTEQDLRARLAGLERLADAALNVVTLPPHDKAYSNEDRRRIWTNALSEAIDALPPAVALRDRSAALRLVVSEMKRHDGPVHENTVAMWRATLERALAVETEPRKGGLREAVLAALDEWNQGAVRSDGWPAMAELERVYWSLTIAPPGPIAVSPEPVDCPECDGDGLVAETTADPLPSGEPGEPSQVQHVCSACGGAGRLVVLTEPEYAALLEASR
jgi:hypothetical protein